MSESSFRLEEDAIDYQAYCQQLGSSERCCGSVAIRSNNTSNKHDGLASKDRSGRENRKNSHKLPKSAPVFVYSPHIAKVVSHYISDFKACPEPEKTKYLANYRKKRKMKIKNEQKAQCPRSSPVLHSKKHKVEKSSITLSAIFAERYCEHICTDS